MRRRIFWDAMMLIYLVDGNPDYVDRLRYLLAQAFDRKDLLFTSYVGLGELLAGAGKAVPERTAKVMRELIEAIGFSYLPFGADAVDTFAHLRSVHRVKSADAIHLSCAAAAGMDLFVTNDKLLLKLQIPGIHFIAHYQNPIL